MVRCIALMLAGATMTLPQMLPAQTGTTATLDIGGFHLKPEEGAGTSALTLSPALRFTSPALLFASYGNYARYASAWSAQGTAFLSAYSSPARLVGAELLGVGGGTARQYGASTGEMRGIGRLHLRKSGTGLWLGGGAGAAHDGDSSKALRTFEAGAWIALGEAHAVVSHSPTTIEGLGRYTTTEASVWLPGERLEFTLHGGLRSADSSFAGNWAAGWVNAGVIFWLTRRAGVALAGGSYDGSPAQRYEGGQFLSIALRLVNGRSPRYSAIEVSTRAPVREVPSSAITEFSVTRARGYATVRVLAPTARAVELSGDFTLWEPVQLQREAGGWWSITFPLRPGAYEVNLRVNGGQWIIPPGLLVIRDRVGGSSGRLLIAP
ncbi:hypothetical protein BH23GEM2_BH23GEM2_08340 [soil metagenome]